MKTEKTNITKLLITEAELLDPISVYLEDLEKGKGKITITCFSESWTSYWPGMSDRTISEFFMSRDEHYLAGCLSGCVFICETITDTDKIIEDSFELTGRDYCYDELIHESKIMQQLYGEDWQYHLPERPNPKYQYLCRIINAVKEGLVKEGLACSKK